MNTNKLKLILLSVILLVSQLNGTLIKFSDTQLIEVDTTQLDTTFKNLPTQPTPNPSNPRYIELNITHEEFNIVIGTLIIVERLNNDVEKQIINTNEAIERMVQELRYHSPQYTNILRQINVSLKCELLSNALTKLDECLTIEETIFSKRSRKNKAQPRSRTICPSSCENLHKTSINSIPLYLLPDKITIATLDELLTIPKTMYQLSKKLISETQKEPTEIFTLLINNNQKKLLFTPWEMLAERKSSQEIIAYLKTYSLEQINLIMPDVKFLDIQELISMLIHVIANKLEEPINLERFQQNPKEFIQQFSNFNLDNFRQMIIEASSPFYTASKFQDPVRALIALPNGQLIKTYSGQENNGQDKVKTYFPLTFETFSTYQDMAKIVTLNPTSGEYDETKLEKNNPLIRNMYISPDGDISTGFIHQATKIRFLNHDKETLSSIELIKDRKDITTLATLPNKRFITGSNNGKIIIWQKDPLRIKSIFTSLKQEEERIDLIQTLPNDGFIVTSKNLLTNKNTIKMWTKITTSNLTLEQYLLITLCSKLYPGIDLTSEENLQLLEIFVTLSDYIKIILIKHGLVKSLK